MFSIIIPAYKEGSVIAITIFDIKKVLAVNNIVGAEIIVVDDGSTDRTADMSKKAGAITISHPHNIGCGRSLKDGIRTATHDTIVITDADGTYPLEMIPVLINEYQKGFDMVVGARPGENYDVSFKKRILRLILKKMTEFTAGKKIPDINSGFRVFSKKGILPYFSKLCDTFSFTTSLTLAYMMNGKFVQYLPIDYKKRESKTKVKFLREIMRTFQFFMESILFYNPLKFFVLFCLCLLGLAGIDFIFSIIFKIPTSFYFGVGCVILSILMFGFGLISVQLKLIMSITENPKSD